MFFNQSCKGEIQRRNVGQCPIISVASTAESNSQPFKERDNLKLLPCFKDLVYFLKNEDMQNQYRKVVGFLNVYIK